MLRRPSFRLCLAAALVLGRAGLAGEIVTDANIVTGLDISESIGAAAMRSELQGIARAIRSPEVLAAIRRGATGRIGFAVFAWHQRQFEVVPWTLIASERDAEAVAEALEARMSVDADREARSAGPYHIGRLTDLSRAIDHAGALLAAAPVSGGRSVVNVIGNGADNMGEGAAPARDRLLDVGATLNGLVFGGDPGTIAYFRDEVVGGTGAFLIAADGSAAVLEVMRRKFLRDLVAGPLPPSASFF
jgi:uncharacterized protein DUF1194